MSDLDRRKGFEEWLERQPSTEWSAMPLTHIAKALVAEDIIRDGSVKPSKCDIFKRSISYFFYGRPAYRVAGDGQIKSEAACPVCFVFKPDTVSYAARIYPFDTGAFAKRMYKSHMMDEMNVHDFELVSPKYEPNTVVAAIFPSIEDYLRGNLEKLKTSNAEAWDFHARALLDLFSSKGRNEPDDRVFSVEVQVEEEVKLKGNLLAIVVPHTLWSTSSQTPWLQSLLESGIEIQTYTFNSNRHPEYYQAQIEGIVNDLYSKWKMIR